MEGWPCFEEDELQAVSRVLRSGWVNYWSGEEGISFEREFAAFHDVPHAIALANGTVALELALHALGVGPGDEVVVTPRSFVASVSCVVARGARPVFADVDPDSGNLTAESVRAVLTARTRAIIAVHLAGWPCDLDALRALADEGGLWLIEDCAQAHGATWRGRLVGSVGDAAAFSFCTDKIISTGGEGGMLLLRDEKAWRRAWSYKDHGKSWEAVHAEHPPGFRWLHESFGMAAHRDAVRDRPGAAAQAPGTGRGGPMPSGSGPRRGPARGCGCPSHRPISNTPPTRPMSSWSPGA